MGSTLPFREGEGVIFPPPANISVGVGEEDDRGRVGRAGVQELGMDARTRQRMPLCLFASLPLAIRAGDKPYGIIS